ncbi:unnamed protein product [Medioppia subpectinata]|uniref:Glycoside hydrolase 35 catalytic domain-containing protein n=1 Tax=Medioppia subpectinata TaxID=1979941 RepID=A0A7R9PXW7_9ACAR|nr:unnamed protein product [Medioppia subpectinata]CAG2105466.1 unnamed protein product [Medioppia subpectinata]
MVVQLPQGYFECIKRVSVEPHVWVAYEPRGESSQFPLGVNVWPDSEPHKHIGECPHITETGLEVPLTRCVLVYVPGHVQCLHTVLSPAALNLNSLSFQYSCGNRNVKCSESALSLDAMPPAWDFETGFRNVRAFLQAVKDADMFVWFRIGPYIDAEWELGGFPAWLIRDPHMRLNTNYGPYLTAVEAYFKRVLSLIDEFQFQKGGPIIALQFENEFGGIRSAGDRQYFDLMRNTIINSSFKELLTNCDSQETPLTALKTIQKDVLETINFNSRSLKLLTELRQAQPNKPLYVSEFWPGWFDEWGGKHAYYSVTDVVFNANLSINFYMFFGGTNFGFMNGGPNLVTSYDYNAPIFESGNYADKYWETKELIEKFNKRGVNQNY